MNTYFQKAEEAQNGRKWVVVDAAGIPLGRLATRVADIVRGKHRPNYTPHVDGGDFVVVLNASKVVLTGKKMEQKKYHWVTGYIGGIKSVTAGEMIRKNPERAIKRAVQGMLPEGILGHRLLNKVKVYEGTDHPHGAQQPETINLAQ